MTVTGVHSERAALTDHALAPAAQYLRTLWDARWLFLLVVAIFVGGSIIVTALLPKTYSSQAIVSVRQAPSLASMGLLYDSVMATARPAEEGGERQELVPRRFLKRLQAPRTVTLAAQEAGVIDSSTALDERQITKWVEAEQVEKTDLIALTVNQPTADAARLFAQKLLDRTIDFSRQENTSADTRELITAQVARAEATLSEAEKRVAQHETAGAARTPEERLRHERATMDLDLARKAYAPLRRRLDAVDLLLAEQQLQLHVVDPPTLASRPSFPRPVLNVSIGLILGILTATVFVIVRSIFPAARRRM